MPIGWLRSKSASGDKKTVGGGTGTRATRAKEKRRRERRERWFKRQPGAVPPAPKPAKPRGKKQRASDEDATPLVAAWVRRKTHRASGDASGDRASAAEPFPVVAPPHEGLVEERETLTWLGHSDLAAKLNASDDGKAKGFGYDDAGFPVNIPGPTRTKRADSTEQATTDEAGFGTGPPPQKGQAMPDRFVSATSADRARHAFMASQDDARTSALLWATEAQWYRDEAGALEAADLQNETNEHQNTIQHFREMAEECDQNSIQNQQKADAWGEQLANVFGRIQARQGG